MSGSPVELTVGGKTYRVVASAEESVLQRLANLVDARLRDLTPPGRPIAPQSLLLAAITLAHELEEERDRRRQVELRAREMLTSVLDRIDRALEDAEAAGAPRDTLPPPSEPTRPDNPVPPRF